MINFSGHNFLFFLASGIMGFDGEGPTWAHRVFYRILKELSLFDPNLFATVTKTITFPPHEGAKKIKFIRDGWWNKFELDNPGLKKFLKKHGPILKDRDNIIISILSRKREEIKTMMKEFLYSFPKLLAVEYNASCPNAPSDMLIGNRVTVKMCNFIANCFHVPVIVKVGSRSNYLEIAKKTEGVVSAISINSVPVEGGGAISGKRAQEVNWRIIRDLKENTSTPVIGGSIWSYEDMIYLLNDLKVDGISFGSVSLFHPKRPLAPVLPTLWARRYFKENEMAEKENKTLPFWVRKYYR